MLSLRLPVSRGRRPMGFALFKGRPQSAYALNRQGGSFNLMQQAHAKSDPFA